MIEFGSLVVAPNDAVAVMSVEVLKLLKLARSVRALLDTVMQALPEVGNLGLLFHLGTGASDCPSVQ